MKALSLTLMLALAPPQRLTPGERFEFAIDFKGLRLGRAELYLGDGDGSVIPAFLQSRTTGVASIVTLRQHIASVIDRSSGLPRSNSLEAVEGDYRHVDTTSFDRVAHKARVRQRGKFDRSYVVDVPPGTMDFVSLLYRLRELPLAPGFKQRFHVLARTTVSEIEAEVVAREQVSTSIGEISALKVRVPTNFQGEFEEKNPTYVWFSDDERRLPVRISTDFAIGRAVAKLVAYEPGRSVGAARGQR